MGSMRSAFAVGVGVTLKAVALVLLLWNTTRSLPAMTDPPGGCADDNYQTACDSGAWRAWQNENTARRREFVTEGRLIVGTMVVLLLAGGSLLWFGLSPARPVA